MKKIRLNIKSILRAYNIKSMNTVENNKQVSTTQKKSEFAHKRTNNMEHTDVKDINNDLPLMLFI
jgi:hypothetical protein